MDNNDEAQNMLDQYAHLFGLKKSGNGWQEMHPVKCQKCNGKGILPSKKKLFRTCPDCKGKGMKYE